MDQRVLQYFYKLEGNQNIFLKSYFIRLIRNRIIDPNTQNILADGFEFLDYNLDIKTSIPCDDSNWCEYMTYKEGFELGVLTFPFSLKLHNDHFMTLNSLDEYLDILSLVIEFRAKTIKKGWAIKYGFEYEDIKYPLLEDLDEAALLNWKDPRGKVRYYLDDVKPEDLR